MSKRVNWYVVVNAESTVLAVYGSALADEAQSKARELAKLGPVALRLVASIKHPATGYPLKLRSLSMAF